MYNRKNCVRIAGVGITAAAAAGLLSTGVSSADTFIPLPGGQLSKTLPNGIDITVRLVGESATINPSMGSTPLHRNTWVSASAQVELSGPNVKDVGAKIAPGYVVGCQVDISGGNTGAGVNGSTNWEGDKVSASSTASANLTLGPGQTAKHMILDLENADDYGQEQHSRNTPFRGGSGSVTWADSTIALNGCAGYAQARAFVLVKVRGPQGVSMVTLWGQPFSLG